MARKDERSTRLRQASGARHSTLNAEFSKGAPCSVIQICLTSTLALRESIDQRSRSNRHSGADDCWQTVFTVDE